MLRGLYQAGTALQSATANQELAADNLSNATTPGFRRQGMIFDAVLAQRTSATLPVNTRTGHTGESGNSFYTNFTPGPLQQTGNPLDLALTGDAFFTLEGPNGPVYTRNGAFVINGRGELQTPSGLRARGQGGPITIPLEAAQIRISSDGVVYADGAEVGRLQLAQFDSHQALRRVGTTLFEGPAPRQPDSGDVRVEQGFREGSNVEMVQEMVGMIVGMRQYEAAERALRALGDALGHNTRPQGS